LRASAISSIILCYAARVSLRCASEAVPIKCARNETGAELLIEDSKSE
jgi:hypothetical protein